MSRSTWACELKLLLPAVSNIAHSHAPRERVSWNTPHKFRHTFASVTLHVSVWVEITWFCLYSLFALVTLHVSVWVEMMILSVWAKCSQGHAPRERVSWNKADCYSKCRPRKSRSTWACELKFSQKRYMCHINQSRSTWACELKFVSL